MLEVRLLGQFDLRIDGQPIELPSRPAQSLLAFLCLNPEVQHRRERLAGMFWPDSDERNARSNLRHALWRLGENLGKVYFSADNFYISLNRQAGVWVDAVEFEAASAGQPLDTLMAAMDLYQGELLPGFYDEWLDLERERLRSQMDAKVEHLVERLSEAGRWAAVIQWSERWLALGHLPEAAFRFLMQAYRALGDGARVAETYERCVQTLREQLDVAVSPETTELYRELMTAKASRPADLGPSAQRRKVESTERSADLAWGSWPTIEPAPTSGPEPAFVGREHELAVLQTSLDQTLAGRGRMAFIVGETGSGKTALATFFAKAAQANHPELAVAVGRCDVYTGVGSPFGPFRQVLGALMTGRSFTAQSEGMSRTLAGAIDPLDRRLPGGNSEYRRELAEFMLPDPWIGGASGVGAMTGRAAVPVEGGASREDHEAASGPHRNKVLEAYADLLLGISQEHPLVAILDDLHWIDPSSANLLFQLSELVRGVPILVIGILRMEEILPQPDGTPHPLKPVINENKRSYDDVWIDMDRDDYEHASKFVDQLLETQKTRLGESLRERLTRTTRGQPFFVLELLRDLQERGGIVEDSGGVWREAGSFDLDVLPTRVEAVVEERINRLNDELREALTIASVQGESFVAEVVAEIQGVDAGALVRRLSSELGRRYRLVEEVGVERVSDRLVSRFRFRHVLIQKYLYQRLGQGEHAYLHEAAGRCLEKVYAGSEYQPARDLARHFVEAGLGERAVKYLQTSGEQALRISAYEEAGRHLARAKEVILSSGDIPAASASRLAVIERMLGEAAYGLGDLGLASSHLERAVELLGFPVPKTETRAIASVLWQSLVQLGHLVVPPSQSESRSVLREAASASKLLAEIYLVWNRTLLTLYATLRGLNLAEAGGPSPELARAYADASVVTPLLRIAWMGERYRGRALRLLDELNDLRVEAYVHLSTSILTLGEGNWSVSIPSLARANKIHEETGDWNRLGVGLMLSANCRSLQGDNVGSLSVYEELCALAEKSGNLEHLAWGIDGRAKCLIRMGEAAQIEQAQGLLEESKRLLDGQGIFQEEVEVRGLLATAKLLLGNVDQALIEAEAASEIADRSSPNFFSQVEGYSGVARTCLAAWEDKLARGETVDSDLRHLTARSMRTLTRLAKFFPVCRPRQAVWHGLHIWLGGRPQAGRQAWRRAAELAHSLGMPFEEGLALFELGRHPGGSHTGRADQLERASRLFHNIQAMGEYRLARQAYDSLVASN